MVAVDLRGYGETERPGNVLDYTFDKLKQDVVELVPALGYTKCILVAHDWGGVIGWCVCVEGGWEEDCVCSHVHAVHMCIFNLH